MKLISRSLYKVLRGSKATLISFFALTLIYGVSYAESIDQVRWKTESQVEEIFGTPIKKSSPVGTHATYTLWEYEGFTVAFANNRAFHVFKKDSLRQIRLDENRD